MAYWDGGSGYNHSELSEIVPETTETGTQEANDVFCSFINEVVPGSQNCTSHLSGSTSNEVGRTLALIGDDVMRKYSSVFMELSKKMGLQTGVLSTYRDFVDVVSSLFSDGINWGRIIVLMVFGCFVITTFVMNRRIVQNILGYVLRFLKEKFLGWIGRHGGWRTAVTGAVSNRTSATPLGTCVTSCIAAIKAMFNIFSPK